ncbi:hypothetical protein EBT11_06715 [bacterium]|nr:hypothetical protein [bacterium]NBV97115.1 hypothetical protein [Verrucomicrobiota bacterium]
MLPFLFEATPAVKSNKLLHRFYFPNFTLSETSHPFFHSVCLGTIKTARFCQHPSARFEK